MTRVTNGQKHLVDQYTISGQFVKRWASVTDVSKHFNTSNGNIANAARGERKSAQGFVWKYAEEAIDPNEVWIDHPFLTIKVSSLGRVEFSKKRPRRTFGQARRDGYHRIRISDQNNVRKNYSVHRLIAEAWFPDKKTLVDSRCDNRAQVDHIDKDPSNNVLTNLRWVTPSENVLARYNKFLP